MLKTILLASAMTISVPAFAQDQTTPQQTAPGREATAPTEVPDQTMTPQPEQSTPAETTAAQPASDATVQDQAQTATIAEQAAQTPATPAQAAPAEQAVAAAPAADSQPASGGSQVAQIVNAEFPSYDRNSDGSLDKGEFGSWMVALKTASDPATKAEDPATQTWVTGALASADTDKSSTITKEELTAYLSKGAAS